MSAPIPCGSRMKPPQMEEYMKLITEEIKRALARNLKLPEAERKPVFKLFTPWGSATWLISEIDDTNMMFGLADLGFGSPELGFIPLDELKEIRGPFGLGIERDLHFTADKTLAEYADAARAAGHIAA